jgi:hypothetical protein
MNSPYIDNNTFVFASGNLNSYGIYECNISSNPISVSGNVFAFIFTSGALYYDFNTTSGTTVKRRVLDLDTELSLSGQTGTLASWGNTL